MTKIKRLSGLLFTILATGCLGDHELDARHDMSAAVAEAETENERHAGACGIVRSMSEMMDELERHEDAMASLMTRMMGARDGMMGMHACGGANLDHMSDSVDGARSEMMDHSERMRAAETLDATRAECDAHTQVVGGMMQGMMDDLDSMPCMHGGMDR